MNPEAIPEPLSMAELAAILEQFPVPPSPDSPLWLPKPAHEFKVEPAPERYFFYQGIGGIMMPNPQSPDHDFHQRQAEHVSRLIDENPGAPAGKG